MSHLPLPSSNTLRFKNLSESDIHPQETIIFSADSGENRSNLPLWNTISSLTPERVIKIKKVSKEEISVKHGNAPEITISLRDEQAIDKFLCSERILIDVTGLNHDVWAPLFRRAYENKIYTRIAYAEPESYKPHPSPASAAIFDLSVTFDGLAPLPGFAQLSGPEDEEQCLFIAMLGFEGNRPEHLAAQLDPSPKVIPVVGAPGFQIEYPAFTVGCNRLFLDEYKAHSEMRYARASCPFEAFESLNKIRQDYPDHYMYLALAGTKPHALGAILFAIKNPETSEIMFDYPVKKSGRTQGIGVVHIYDFENFHAY